MNRKHKKPKKRNIYEQEARITAVSDVEETAYDDGDDTEYYGDDIDVEDYDDADYYDDGDDAEFYDDGDDDGEYYDGDDDGEYYDEDAYYDDRDEDEDEDEPDANLSFFKRLTPADYAVAITGVIVLAVALISAHIFFGNRETQEQLAEYGNMGMQIDDIKVIGGEGLVAIRNAELTRRIAAEAKEHEEEEHIEEDAHIAVEMDLSSIYKDLKIKFASKKTGRLVANAPFEVSVTDPYKQTSTYVNEKRDGLIHLEDIAAGTYEVAMIKNETLHDYDFDTEPMKITVKAEIEYKSVDVSNEIKKESEVNVAAEDTKVTPPDEEVTRDTVEWVESTRTLIGETSGVEYVEVQKSTINDPATAVKATFRDFKLHITALAGNEDDPEASPSPEPEPDPSPEPSTTPDPEPSPSPSAAPSPNPSPDPSPNPSPSPSPEPTPAPSPIPSPSPSPSVSPSPSPSPGPSASPTASPADPKQDTKTPLSTKGKEKVYVVKGSKYVEAVSADYYTANKFYVQRKVSIPIYRYTGWQDIDGQTYYYDKNGKYVTGEQIIQGAKYFFASDGALARGSGQRGIDVSKWNGTINWSAVKSAGYDFVIIRCGYRGSTTGTMIEDPTFKTNARGAIAAGLKVGVYFFSQAINEREAVEEASMTISLIKDFRITYPVFIDVEGSGGRADGLGRAERTAICRAFAQTVQNSGYTGGIYSNKDWYTNRINVRELTQYKIWLAHYTAQTDYNITRYDMWQYSHRGSVPGISGNVDLNISYLGY